MALEGTLRDFSLADILQLISLQKKTGLLTLKSPDDTVHLGFSDGRLVSAESSAKRMDTRLGTVLVRTRRLRPEALQKALEIQGQTLQRLGFILLKNGFCSPSDLREGLDLQIRKIVYGLFRWTDGEYVFDQQDHIDYDEEFVSPIGVESVLMEGARMMDEWPIIERVVRSFDLVYARKPVLQPVEPADHEEEEDSFGEATMLKRAHEKKKDEPIRVSRAEWQVWELVDGRRSVSEILERTFLSDFDGCKAVYDLVSRGLVEEVNPGAAVLDVERTGSISIEMPRLGRQVAPRQAFILTVIGILFCLASIPIQHINPLNVLTTPPRPHALLDTWAKAQSLQRMRRLVEALDTHYLTVGGYPQSLEHLVTQALVPSSDIRDPWGHPYGYILKEEKSEKLYLIGYTRDGKADIDLLIVYPLRQGAAAASPARAGKKDLIVIE